MNHNRLPLSPLIEQLLQHIILSFLSLQDLAVVAQVCQSVLKGALLVMQSATRPFHPSEAQYIVRVMLSNVRSMPKLLGKFDKFLLRIHNMDSDGQSAFAMESLSRNRLYVIEYCHTEHFVDSLLLQSIMLVSHEQTFDMLFKLDNTELAASIDRALQKRPQSCSLSAKNELIAKSSYLLK